VAFTEALDLVSRWAVPLILVAIPLYGYIKGVKVYELFVEGAAEGFTLGVRIIPYLVAMFVALGMFRASGAMDLLTGLVGPALKVLGVPAEVVPLMLIRPLSGGGALGVTAELIRTHGPDSFIGRLASTMQGSTETTFFVLTFYFGSVGVKKPRHSVAAGLCGDLAGYVGAVVACRLLFG